MLYGFLNSPNSSYIDEIAKVLDGVDIIVSGVSSPGVHWIGQTLGPHLRPRQIIIAITKGMEATENGDLIILPDVLAAELPENIRKQVKLAAIGGPCIAGELAGHKHSMVVFGSRDSEAVEHLATTFRTHYYHIWTTTDLLGLEICAAMKNAFTLGVGLDAGILEQAGGVDSAEAYTHNLAAGLFGEGCTEIDRMLQIMGGTRSLAHGLPGAGDLYVTSMGGRTVRLGKLLGMGHTYTEARQIMAGETLESAEIVQVMGHALPKLAGRNIINLGDFPLLRTLIDIVVHGHPANLLMDTFFNNMRL